MANPNTDKPATAAELEAELLVADGTDNELQVAAEVCDRALAALAAAEARAVALEKEVARLREIADDWRRATAAAEHETCAVEGSRDALQARLDQQEKLGWCAWTDAAKAELHPPFRVEQDWTWEVIDANGVRVAKHQHAAHAETTAAVLNAAAAHDATLRRAERQRAGELARDKFGDFDNVENAMAAFLDELEGGDETTRI